MIPGFDEAGQGQSRHRRRRREPRRRRGLKSILALVVVLALLGALALAGVWGVRTVRGYFTAKDYPGSGTGEALIHVEDQDTATMIATKLYGAHVVRSEKAFIDAAKADPHSVDIQVGFYRLRQQMKASLALAALLAHNGDGTLANRVSMSVNIPEGAITLDVYTLLSKATGIPVSSFVDAARDPLALGVPADWYVRKDGKPPLKPPSLEGFLYPDHYDFDPGMNATAILSAMVHRFLDVTGKLGFVTAVQRDPQLTPYEALVAASIAQVEALQPDMPGVAAVLYNRAFKQFACNCLGLDSEVNYWLRISGGKPQASGALRLSQLHDPKDPYNTHDKPGLPVGPISNPGEAALSAAMNPAHSADYYFLAIDKQGHAAFAPTKVAFCQLVTKAIANGVSASPC